MKPSKSSSSFSSSIFGHFSFGFCHYSRIYSCSKPWKWIVQWSGNGEWLKNRICPQTATASTSTLSSPFYIVVRCLLPALASITFCYGWHALHFKFQRSRKINCSLFKLQQAAESLSFSLFWLLRSLLTILLLMRFALMVSHQLYSSHTPALIHTTKYITQCNFQALEKKLTMWHVRARDRGSCNRQPPSIPANQNAYGFLN